ncbi:type III restriction endonuclease subunit R [Microbacterium bovistercoris]|uniref:Type III restriction endonuclease subunit R n=1 Tax=Microbacterium bovistercoris TaxID=2293570 RepID=A0A371P067_9MICO|nr:DEAD/DEAH box helicase family protein [Microbacterium bovistercoris]REJ08749.1 type III restriction endonuclease subunit R [Microbacterium bovistercoris]
MRFTLKDYQADAVVQTLDNLRRARRLYQNEGMETSFALTATTGAGKTVMAAAAIEALFYGDAELDFEPDPGAVVIWFSDDPNLNEQTKRRLVQASEKLTYDRLITIKPPFALPALEPQTVYFLNTQRLSKTSLLTRGAEQATTADADGMIPASPDDLAWNIWETLANTIEDDGLTVYLVLDEAHRGFTTKTSRDKPTIVRRLVSGEMTGLPIPIVWGISATIDRFIEAMKEAATPLQGRTTLPAVTVDPARVQQSGLIKDVIALDIPAESGNLETSLTTRAARKLKDSAKRWGKYLAEQKALPGETSTDSVVPLMVLQIPNTENPDDVGLWLDTIQSELGDLSSANVRHVLGDHKVLTFGSWDVDWIEPQRVQDETQVRVLIAKDGISTGWDCPRAEVLISFRPAKDHTHITQLLGRMVRTPLARRIPGEDRLNSVDCILPHFDRTTAGNVAKYLTGLTDSMPTTGQKVLLDPRNLEPNPAVPGSVWACWDELPSMVIPRRGSRPVKQLVSLAQALAADSLKPGAVASVQAQMHNTLESLAARYDGQLHSAEIEVRTVRGTTIAGRMASKKLSYADFNERADERAIRVAFEDAKRAFGADVAQSYVDFLADPETDDSDEALRDAFVKAAALATVPNVREKVDEAAKEIVSEWFGQHRVSIRGLSDERREAYDEIKSQAVDPQLAQLTRPKSRLEDFAETVDGQVRVAELIDKHLMSDEDGWFPLSSLNGWEQAVAKREVARTDCIAWYRNPSVSRPDALGIPYRDGIGNWRTLHPDFLIFSEVNGEIRPSIVDPHGTHLDDSLVKLRGLADFAEAYGDAFHRIDSLGTTGASGELRVLDMLDPAVRDAVRQAKGAAGDLYASSLGSKYA